MNWLTKIEHGENEITEFKQSFNKQTLESIVAFANHKGGKILLEFRTKRKF